MHESLIDVSYHLPHSHQLGQKWKESRIKLFWWLCLHLPEEYLTDLHEGFDVVFAVGLFDLALGFVVAEAVEDFEKWKSYS